MSLEILAENKSYKKSNGSTRTEKNTIFKMEKSMAGFNSRSDTAEERIN